MEKHVTYRPFGIYKWFAHFLVFCDICFFVISGYLLTDLTDIDFFYFLTMGVVSLILAKYLYDLSCITLSFEVDRILVWRSRSRDVHCILWDNLSFAYYIKNSKGHLFVVSPQALTREQVKRYIRHGRKICVDSSLVICIGIIETNHQIREQIDSKISTIEEIERYSLH